MQAIAAHSLPFARCIHCGSRRAQAHGGLSLDPEGVVLAPDTGLLTQGAFQGRSSRVRPRTAQTARGRPGRSRGLVLRHDLEPPASQVDAARIVGRQLAARVDNACRDEDGSIADRSFPGDPISVNPRMWSSAPHRERAQASRRIAVGAERTRLGGGADRRAQRRCPRARYGGVAGGAHNRAAHGLRAGIEARQYLRPKSPKVSYDRSPSRSTYDLRRGVPVGVFTGKSRLEQALQLRPDHSGRESAGGRISSKTWVPRSRAISRDEYLTTKFGLARAATSRMRRRVAAAGEAAGLSLQECDNDRAPAEHASTCHRLIQRARNTGASGKMKQRLMEL
jgi:hypothetical protein